MRKIYTTAILILTLALAACSNTDVPVKEDTDVKEVQETKDVAISESDKEKVAMYMINLTQYLEGLQLADEEVGLTSLDMSTGRIDPEDARPTFEATRELYQLTVQELNDMPLPDIQDKELSELTKDVHNLLIVCAETGEAASVDFLEFIDSNSDSTDRATKYVDDISDYTELLQTKVDLMLSKIQ